MSKHYECPNRGNANQRRPDYGNLEMRISARLTGDETEWVVEQANRNNTSIARIVRLCIRKAMVAP